ncbi:MAG: hypothetical protein ACK4XJ_08175 [Fimbriimonadaceae bacterium]
MSVEVNVMTYQRFIACGLAGLLVAAVSFAQPVAIPSVGANLDAIEDFSRTHALADLVKQSRQFGDPQRPFEPGTVKFDKNGWPTTDFGVILMTDVGTQIGLGGTYKLKGTFNQLPTIELLPGSPGTIQNVKRNANNGNVTADIVFPEGGEQMFLSFRNTGGGVQNLEVVRPGMTAKQRFTPAFLEHLKRYSILRFMDWGKTNFSEQRVPADRPKVTDAQWTIKGVPYEVMIELANVTNKDAWICIPHLANDNYIKQVAKLCRTKLNPNLKLYVEYSNEVWNFGFTQAHDNIDAAIAEVASGKSDLNFDGSEDQFFWAARRVGQRIARISALFRAEYGQAAFNARVRPVLGTQMAFPELWLDQGLFYIARRVGQPLDIISGGVAFAPYFNMGDKQFSEGLNVNGVINALNKSMANAGVEYKYEYNRARALWFRLPTIAYEGGPDTFGSGSLNAKFRAQSDLRMRTLVSDYLRNWFAFDFGPFCWFVAGATSWDTQFGAWGVTDDMAIQNTPKINGLDDIINGSPIRVTGGMAVPANLDARQHIARFPDFKTRDPFLRFFNVGDVFDYLVRVDQPGNFEIDVTAASERNDGLISICTNGIREMTVAIPNTGSMETFRATQATAPVRLEAGLHCIRLRIERGTPYNIKLLRVRRV